MLAHIAEVDSRKLYLPAAHPSMYSYCVEVLRLSEDATFKRIRAARAARRFPSIFPALAEGRLHLSGVVVLAPFLTDGAATELLKMAEHRTTKEIEKLLAERFPRPDLPTRIHALELASRPVGEVAPGPVGSLADADLPGLVTERPVSLLSPRTIDESQLASRPVGVESQLSTGTFGASQLASRPVETQRAQVSPLSAQKYGLQVTIRQETYEYLKCAQALLGHHVAPGDVAEVLHRALRSYVAELEKQKFAATDRPRPARDSKNPRHVPAHVKRSVWERDGGQCTFTNDAGQRCPARSCLEFDHADPVARGGEATLESIRLRCRAHNQYIAERVFGEEFMQQKRRAAAARAHDLKRACIATLAAPRAQAGT
jgi:5-methylcytosine-specific restriction endonuclease McrA